MPSTALNAAAHPPAHDLQYLENQITELAAHIHAATFRWLELVREYDERRGWAGPGMRSCAHWLNWQCGIALGAAREKLRVAHALKGLPRISAAFREGRVSYSKVRAMTRVATPENEGYLLMIANHGTAVHVERLVRQYRRVKRAEALNEENRRHATRELNWFEDEDGSWVLRGRFTPEQGAVIAKALEGALEEMFRERRDVPAGTPPEETPEQGKPRAEPVAQCRADALARVAEGYLSGSNQSYTGDRFLVHLHTAPETLQADGGGAEAELEGGGRVPAETSRRLSCDTGVVHWRENGAGEALDIGRKSRTVPPAIRRALARRDQGCRFPGCTATRFVDAHHIVHWADGGETSLSNLVLLCRHHHRLVHEGGFAVSTERDGGIQFHDPAGECLSSGPKTRSRGNVFALTDAHHRNGIRITPETPVPRWRGERMDDDLAVLGLLQRE